METDIWFRPLVWTDYRLAVLFTILFPLILLIWGLLKKSDAVQRLLIIYWRVASLLMITLYILIPGWQIGFISSFAARLLIPISLWFWVDLNDEIEDLPQQGLRLAVTSWRWAVTIYCVLGAIGFIPVLPCAFSGEVLETPLCQVWLEAPQQYKAIFHPNSTPGFLGFVGVFTLIVYVLYLAYFILVRLGRQGRIAMEQ
ncbi:MAG: DUF3177 family protein [Chroococcales cyanobacterium]